MGLGTTIKALFTAKENISEALDNISASTGITRDRVDDLQTELQELSGANQISERTFKELRSASNEVNKSIDATERSISDINKTLSLLTQGAITSEEAAEELSNSVNSLLTSAEATDKHIEGLNRTFSKLTRQEVNTNKATESLEDTIGSIGNKSIVSSQGVKILSRAFSSANIDARAADRAAEGFSNSLAGLSASAMAMATSTEVADTRIESLTKSLAGVSSASAAATIPTGAVAKSLDSIGDQASDASRDVKSLTGDLGILSAVAGTTAFKFSSLSVNIGPFNLALKNILTQLPIILTGMSTMLAMVTSLAAAFVTLGLVTGGLLAGGALAFFEEFSAQFEESAEATEALMGALRDLFVAALEPIMTEANMDLFIDSINAAARVVNRFAQFVNQMRGDVMAFLGSLDVGIEDMFEAMHDSFVAMRPILRAFIEFFINDLPGIIDRFSDITTQLSGNIGNIITAVGSLIDQLLTFATVLIDVLAPFIIGILTLLKDVFIFFNTLPDGVLNTALTFAALAVGIGYVIVKLAALAHWMAGVNAAMASQAAAGSILAITYKKLQEELVGYLRGEQSLRAALAATRASLYKNLALWFEHAAAKMFSISTTNALTLAMGKQAGIMNALFLRNIGLVAAMKLTAANMWGLMKATVAATWSLIKQIPAALASATSFIALGTASLFASAAVWTLNAALAVLTSPITFLIVVIAGLIGLLGALFTVLTGKNIFAVFINGAKEAIQWVRELISNLDILSRLGFGPDLDASVDTDDISTESNIDLSFEEAIENNVDVQADPEDTAGLTRITKDALEEANSLARRQQGGQ